MNVKQGKEVVLDQEFSLLDATEYNYPHPKIEKEAKYLFV